MSVSDSSEVLLRFAVFFAGAALASAAAPSSSSSMSLYRFFESAFFESEVALAFCVVVEALFGRFVGGSGLSSAGSMSSARRLFDSIEVARPVFCGAISTGSQSDATSFPLREEPFLLFDSFGFILGSAFDVTGFFELEDLLLSVAESFAFEEDLGALDEAFTGLFLLVGMTEER